MYTTQQLATDLINEVSSHPFFFRLLGTTEVSLVDVLSGKKFDVTKTLTGMHAGHHNVSA